MQRIRNTVSGPTEPRDTHVFWVDTSNPESPVLKMFNGGWVAVSESEGGGGGSQGGGLNILQTEENLPELPAVSQELTTAEMAEYFHITEQELRDLYDGKYSGIVGPNNIPYFLIQVSPDLGYSTDFNIAYMGSSGFQIYHTAVDTWTNAYIWD